MLNTYIGKKGYTVSKKELGEQKVKKLKEQYVVKTRSTVVDVTRNKSKRKNKNFYNLNEGKNDR